MANVHIDPSFDDEGRMRTDHLAELLELRSHKWV